MRIPGCADCADATFILADPAVSVDWRHLLLGVDLGQAQGGIHSVHVTQLKSVFALDVLLEKLQQVAFVKVVGKCQGGVVLQVTVGLAFVIGPDAVAWPEIATLFEKFQFTL